MNLTMLLDMVAEGMPERVLIGDLDNGMTARELASRAMAGSEPCGRPAPTPWSISTATGRRSP